MDFITYLQSQHVYRPESKNELESKLQRIYHNLQATRKTLKPKQKWSNISHADKETIKNLKEKNYVCLPSDKCTDFCIIQRDTYTQLALVHLSDPNTYQMIPRISAKTVEKKINSTWKNICQHNKFPSFVLKSFLSSNTDLPRFCHLIKTHKTGPDIKIQLIVSNTLNEPIQRISCLLANVLKPILKNVPAHFENSLKLKCI